MSPGWMEAAACRGMDVDMFYPPRGSHLVEAAVAVCRGCPVARECLAQAMQRGEHHGVWGGLTADQRHRLAVRTLPPPDPQHPACRSGRHRRAPMSVDAHGQCLACRQDAERARTAAAAGAVR